MSAFLGPIHTWLFNKIVVLENIEKEIEKAFAEEEIKVFHNELKKNIGDYIPNEPLENLIEPSNIHGWLQNSITTSETRQAAFISKILDFNPEGKEIIKEIYNKVGVSSALDIGGKINKPEEIFNALNDILLEGMPCDRVNNVVEKSDKSIVWVTENCVHKNNWESKNIDVENYYDYRASFIKGFVENISDQFTYNYENESKQVHRIIKK